MLNISEFITRSYKSIACKKLQIYPYSLDFLEIFRKDPKMFAIFK